jgi:hypothetical protein
MLKPPPTPWWVTELNYVQLRPCLEICLCGRRKNMWLLLRIRNVAQQSCIELPKTTKIAWSSDCLRIDMNTNILHISRLLSLFHWNWTQTVSKFKRHSSWMETFSIFLLFNSLPPELQQIACEFAKDKSGCHYPWHTTDFLLALGSAWPITSLCKLITLHTINWKVQCNCSAWRSHTWASTSLSTSCRSNSLSFHYLQSEEYNVKDTPPHLLSVYRTRAK